MSTRSSKRTTTTRPPTWSCWLSSTRNPRTTIGIDWWWRCSRNSKSTKSNSTWWVRRTFVWITSSRSSHQIDPFITLYFILIEWTTTNLSRPRSINRSHNQISPTRSMILRKLWMVRWLTDYTKTACSGFASHQQSSSHFPPWQCCVCRRWWKSNKITSYWEAVSRCSRPPMTKLWLEGVCTMNWDPSRYSWRMVKSSPPSTSHRTYYHRVGRGNPTPNVGWITYAPSSTTWRGCRTCTAPKLSTRWSSWGSTTLKR